MKVNKISSDKIDFPDKLLHIPTPPKELFYLGDIQKLQHLPVVSIVGSRAITPYGRQITQKFAAELAGRGVAIVSGLALGVDALAHHAAVEAGGYTAAILPSPVTAIYPASNRQLAKRILEYGGALISEYDQDDRSEAFKSRFIERNRLVAGLADALLVTEASEKSGTLHTVNFALEQGKTVMAVPGNITSPTSAGTNNLIKSGAIPVTDAADIFSALGLKFRQQSFDILPANSAEEAVLNLLKQGVTDSGELHIKSELEPVIFNQTLTMLEISGKVRPLGAGHWTLK